MRPDMKSMKGKKNMNVERRKKSEERLRKLKSTIGRKEVDTEQRKKLGSSRESKQEMKRMRKSLKILLRDMPGIRVPKNSIRRKR